mmetsp:Transcript_62261/g.126808  ORF Transcript_62261/g.126808 Transcript_62261/m.126808 type:complete len:464 (-) Transcript_62261:437-1828(-)
MPVSASHRGSRRNPESTTHVTPGIVREASAIGVDTITRWRGFPLPSLGWFFGYKTSSCSSLGMAPYRAKTSAEFATVVLDESSRTTPLHSATPGKNTRTSPRPGACFRAARSTTFDAAWMSPFRSLRRVARGGMPFRPPPPRLLADIVFTTWFAHCNCIGYCRPSLSMIPQPEVPPSVLISFVPVLTKPPVSSSSSWSLSHSPSAFPRRVADMTTIFRSSSRKFCWTSRSNAREVSEPEPRSWNSSRTTIPIPDSSGSSRRRFSRTPSVTTLMRVEGPNLVSSRMAYPTVPPGEPSPIRADMRWAADRTATRRGATTRICCGWLPMLLLLLSCSASSWRNKSRRSCRGTMVVFPAPGAAWSNRFGLDARLSRTDSRTSKMGNTDDWLMSPSPPSFFSRCCSSRKSVNRPTKTPFLGEWAFNDDGNRAVDEPADNHRCSLAKDELLALSKQRCVPIPRFKALVG